MSDRSGRCGSFQDAKSPAKHDLESGEFTGAVAGHGDIGRPTQEAKGSQTVSESSRIHKPSPKRFSVYA
jgi:hypothetical protein